MLKFMGLTAALVGGAWACGIFDGATRSAGSGTSATSSPATPPMSPEACRELSQKLVLDGLRDIVADQRAGRLAGADQQAYSERQVKALQTRLSQAGCDDAAARSNARHVSTSRIGGTGMPTEFGAPMLDPTPGR